MSKGPNIAGFILGIITVLCGATAIVLNAISLRQDNDGCDY